MKTIMQFRVKGACAHARETPFVINQRACAILLYTFASFGNDTFL